MVMLNTGDERGEHAQGKYMKVLTSLHDNIKDVAVT